ncbi:MAG: hypothetical protein LBT71_03475 [Azoarcus sp.]|nr:hypothetical protein [Azoarcus sp.]
MKVRKTSHAALVTLLLASVCISAPASAHGGVVRDLLLAPLLVPAVIAHAARPTIVVAPPPVVYAPARTVYYEEPRYEEPRYGRPSYRRDVRHAPPPRHGGRWNDRGRHHR